MKRRRPRRLPDASTRISSGEKKTTGSMKRRLPIASRSASTVRRSVYIAWMRIAATWKLNARITCARTPKLTNSTILRPTNMPGETIT